MEPASKKLQNASVLRADWCYNPKVQVIRCVVDVACAGWTICKGSCKAYEIQLDELFSGLAGSCVTPAPARLRLF